MDYNDLLLASHLDSLESDLLIEDKLNNKIEEALEEFKEGKFINQDVVCEYIISDDRLDAALQAFANNSHGMLTDVIRDSVEYIVEHCIGE